MIRKRSPRSTFVLAASSLLIFHAVAFADNLSISGLSFPVDEIVPIDDTSVKISLFGATEIIARANLDEYVAGRYFTEAGRASIFSFEALSDFIRDSVRRGATGRAVQGLAALCSIAKSDQGDDMSELLVSIQNSGATGDFFRTAALEPAVDRCPGALKAELIFRAGSSDSEWLRTKALRVALGNQKELRELAEKKIYQAGTTRNLTELSRFVEFYGAAFGADDARFLDFKRLAATVIDAEDKIKKGSLEVLYSLIDLGKSDALLNDILSPLLIDALHRQAEKLIDHDDAEAALLALSHIDLKKRTPTTHALMRQALLRLYPKERPVFADSGAAVMLQAVAQADPQVKEAYIGYVERLFAYFLQQGLLNDVNYYFPVLTELRPDPSAANDAIRVQEVTGYLKRGMHFLAQEKVKQIQTGVPLFDKLRFAVSGLYFDPLYILVFVFSPVAAGLVLLLVEFLALARRRVTSALKEQRLGREKAEQEDEMQPAFVKPGFARSMSPAMMEFCECLEVFGLKPESDLKAIKAAYRVAVKEVHPDLRKDLNTNDSERFIHLTKTYDRILELYPEVQQPREE